MTSERIDGFMLLVTLIGMIILAFALELEQTKNKKLEKIEFEHLACPIVVKCRIETETEGLMSTNRKVLLRVLWWGVTYECVPVEEVKGKEGETE